MDLKTAVDLVTKDTRAEDPDLPWTGAQTITFARATLQHSDVTLGIEPSNLREAYRAVLDATADEIDQVLSQYR